MRNSITLNGVTYDDDALRGVSVDADVSLDGRTLDVDTLEATVEGTDALTEISRSAPLRFLRGGNPRSVWYAQRVEQIAPALFRVSATSSLGRLAQMSHRGGLYTGQPASDVIDSICGSIPHRVSSTYAARPIYGWLPYVSPSGEASAQTGSAKDNLLQVLFALGAFLRADEDGALVIGELAATSQSVIGPDRIYANGAWVEHEEPVTAVTVLEHQWTPGTDTVTLFDGTATAGQVVIFDEPMGSLAATGITIIESGANFAVLGAGTGRVTGIPYLHQTREVSQTLAAAEIPNTVRVEDATLVSAVNSTEVVARLAAYHSHKTWICCDAQIETEAAGDRVSIFDPFAKIQKDATLQQIYNLQASTVLRGSLRALVGFKPPAPDDAEQVTELLTGSGTWTVPAGVTEISAVLIGGGQGGSRGADGESRMPSVSTGYNTDGGRYFRRGLRHTSNRNPGAGGAAGNAGTGGLIRRVSLQVAAGDVIRYACGAGGAASAAVGGTGEEGEATTFGVYSSAAGELMPSGVYEPLSGQVYGAAGIVGVKGNDGTGYPGSDLVEPEPIAAGGGIWTNGDRVDDTISQEAGSFFATVTAGYGGGAAYGANGGNAERGTLSVTTAGASIHIPQSGRGANAASPQTPNLGQGGSAGHGGGGAGGFGMPTYARGLLADEEDVIVTTDGSTPGGSGSAGTAGGDGCIILSYRIPAQQRTLVSISITTPPTKTAYTEGETFDRTGMVVTATYSDGTTAPVTGYTVSPSGALTTSDTAVTISYTAGTVTRTATQAITVTPAAVTLVSIAITRPPTKTTYYAGESFDRTGMVVTATYSDDSTMPVIGYTVTPSGALSTSNAYVTISYTEGGITRTVRQTIAVQAVTLSSISITTPPTRTAYTEGDTFDPTGMVVTATYSNGDTETVTGYTITPSGALATTDTSVTISYTFAGVTRTATQAITVLAAVTGYTAYTSPQSGVTYQDGLNGITPAQLGLIGRAISDNASITTATTEVWISDVNRHLSVGDVIYFTSDDVGWKIMGFNHYDLTDGAGYGAATATGKAGLLFQSLDVAQTAVAAVTERNDTSGWAELPLRATTAAVLTTLPSAVQQAVKAVDVPCATSFNISDTITVSDRCFLPSQREVFGTNTGSVGGAGEGTRYRYYVENSTAADRIKYSGSTAVTWWLRTIYNGNSPGQRIVQGNGNLSLLNRIPANTSSLAPIINI